MTRTPIPAPLHGFRVFAPLVGDIVGEVEIHLVRDVDTFDTDGEGVTRLIRRYKGFGPVGVAAPHPFVARADPPLENVHIDVQVASDPFGQPRYVPRYVMRQTNN